MRRLSSASCLEHSRFTKPRIRAAISQPLADKTDEQISSLLPRCDCCTDYLGKDKPIRPCSRLARCSPCYTFERNPGLEGCPLSRLGMNLEFPSQQACALFHTPDAEPFVLA
jgi:hypothetical protein